MINFYNQYLYKPTLILITYMKFKITGIYVFSILVFSIFFSWIIFSIPSVFDLWILIMLAPALLGMTFNYIKYRSFRTMIAPITRKPDFNSLLFSFLYPALFLGSLAGLLYVTGIVIPVRPDIPHLTPLQLIIAPLANLLLMYGEEYGWRGFLLEELLKSHTINRSALIAGLVWALFHFPIVFGLANHFQIQNPLVFCLIQMTAVFILSFPFAYSYLLSRSIIGPMLMHFLWNLLNPVLFGNLYSNRPGMFKGNLIVTNGEGIAGILLGLIFMFWFLTRGSNKNKIRYSAQ